MSGCRGVGWALTAGGQEGSCWAVGSVLQLGGGDGCIALNLLKITGHFLNGQLLWKVIIPQLNC